jgi:hypothetical protein
MDTTTVLGVDPPSGQPPRPRAAPAPVRAAARARAGTAAEPMSHRLPWARVVDRDEYLIGAAAGRAVTHVGFAEVTPGRVAQRDGRGLYARLAEVTASLVGVALGPAGAAEARATGQDARLAEEPADVARVGARPAELLIVSDVIEHVDAAGPFLDGLHALVAPGGTMILTAPNACRLLNAAAALGGRELVHPDHVAWYSWHTLVTALERHSWWVVGFNTYQAPANSAGGRLLVAAERTAARLFAPFLANGLIAVCRPLPAEDAPAAIPAVGQRQP